MIYYKKPNRVKSIQYHVVKQLLFTSCENIKNNTLVIMQNTTTILILMSQNQVTKIEFRRKPAFE